MKKRVCVIIERPFQLLNYLNYIYNLENASEYSFDAFIRDESYFPEDMIRRIKETGLFNCVYRHKYTSLDFQKLTGVKVLLHRLKRAVTPKRFIDSISETKPNLSTLRYDYMFCSNLLVIEKAYSLVDPDVKIVLFDDGLGTYSDLLKPATWRRNLLYWLRGKSSPWGKIEKEYVNNVECCNSSLAKKLYALPPLNGASDNFMEMIEYVFGYKHCDLYDDLNLVYLTQKLSPIKDHPYHDTEAELIRIIAGLPQDCVLRVHPEQLGEFNSSLLSLDTTNDSWELLCLNQLNDEHVLIGCFSTAQIMPKLLFKKEPWVIFTFDLYSDLFEETQIDKMKKTAEKLINYYENKHKIMIPQTMNEFIADLSKITSES